MADFSEPHPLTREEAGGMTVNERLWAAGLFDDFYQAIERKDEKSFRIICERLFLGAENTEVLVDKYF